MSIMNMSEVTESKPFEGVDSEYMSINDVLGDEFKIIDTKFFENDKGEGVFILCKEVATELVFHLCTHSIGLVGTMKNPKVQEILGNGDEILTKIVQRKSTKSDRLVYAFA